ncbi:MAG: TlyA family RNA methyltransferase [Microthrixaceae bacterium]
MAGRRRLDAELVRRGLASSRSEARTLVDAGKVITAGTVATKAARMVDPGDSLVVTGEGPRFVGRGGEKLAAALDGFGMDPTGERVLDAGASTGGFTDCLLQAGAREVVALDVGHGQLHERLRSDDRVVVVEKTNIRGVEAGQFGKFDAAVADLSFISLTVVMEPLLGAVEPGAWLVLLVKPQFEAGRRAVAKGAGVVSDPEIWHDAVSSVASAAEQLGAAIMGVMVSPLRGAEGNVEFLMHLVSPSMSPTHVPSGTELPGSPQSVDRAALVDRAVSDAVAQLGQRP